MALTPLTLTMITLVCMGGAYLWGKYETQISVQQISESMLELLVQEGYIKLDKDDNLVKVNDEMVDDSSPVTKNS
jgi:hypothetical protein